MPIELNHIFALRQKKAKGKRNEMHWSWGVHTSNSNRSLGWRSIATFLSPINAIFI